MDQGGARRRGHTPTRFRSSHSRPETRLGFSDEELAFYDALKVNDSAVKVLGDETLKTIARELVDTVHQNTCPYQKVYPTALTATARAEF